MNEIPHVVYDPDGKSFRVGDHELIDIADDFTVSPGSAPCTYRLTISIPLCTFETVPADPQGWAPAPPAAKAANE